MRRERNVSKNMFLLLFELLAGEVLKKCKKSHSRCREVLQKSLFALPCCMGSKKKTLPMQHGSAKNDFCNTSTARMRFFELWFVCCCKYVEIWGQEKNVPAGTLKANSKTMKNYKIFSRLTKSKMFLKPMVGARFRSEEVTATDLTDWDLIAFLQREANAWQKSSLARVPARGAGTRGSTIIYI